MLFRQLAVKKTNKKNPFNYETIILYAIDHICKINPWPQNDTQRTSCAFRDSFETIATSYSTCDYKTIDSQCDFISPHVPEETEALKELYPSSCLHTCIESMCCFSGNRFNILPCSVSNLVLYWGHHSLVVLTQSGFQGGDVCLSTIQWATEAALHLEFQRTQGPLGTVEHRMFSLYFLSLSLWLWSPKLISMFETKAEINSKPRQCKITLGY